MSGIVQNSLLGVSVILLLCSIQHRRDARTRKGYSQAALFTFREAMIIYFYTQQWYCSCLNDEA